MAIGQLSSTDDCRSPSWLLSSRACWGLEYCPQGVDTDMRSHPAPQVQTGPCPSPNHSHFLPHLLPLAEKHSPGPAHRTPGKGC